MCILTGRHKYSPWCEPGAIFLRCTNCGRRSPGWNVTASLPAQKPAAQADRVAAARLPRPALRLVR
jgi:hypothetical protein